MFSAVYFVNTKVPEEKAPVLLSEKEFNELPDDSTNIFKKSSIDRYIERPNVLFSCEEFSAFDNFCFMLNFEHITVSIINQVIHLSIRQMNFKINLLRKTMRRVATQNKSS